MTKLRVLDLFSGIGGFSLGLERTDGFKTVAFCEIEDYPRRVLARHWPGVPCYDDVRTLTGARLAADGLAVDVICGGFPCQDISSAGRRGGLAGERSGLWREYSRLIGELRPNFVIVENVAALLGRGLGDVLGDLASLGYDAEWHCIPASSVGAPHIRDRIWIVGYADSVRQLQPQGGIFDKRGWIGNPSADAADTDSANRRQDGCTRDRLEVGPISIPQREKGSDRLEPSCQNGENAKCFGWREVVEPIFARALGKGPAGTLDNAGVTGGREWWGVEPDVGRVAHGVPSRVDRLKGLGNAVVPQIPELIGRAILAAQEAA
jgi:DNA (cytosine-5)-methyltransferase 1